MKALRAAVLADDGALRRRHPEVFDRGTSCGARSPPLS
jgi:hypothetical protein